MRKESLTILGLQLDLAWEDALANMEKIEALLNAHPEECDIIVLPEMFTTGFTMSPQPWAEPEQGPTQAWMLALAQKRGALVIGSIIVEDQGLFYNRCMAVGPSGLIATYDKRHPFSMSGEDQHYAAGTQRTIFRYKGWRICPMICYDLRFPVWSRNVGPEGGKPVYDLLIYMANWPEKRISHWQTLLQARAIENQCYTLGINRVGTDGYKLSYVGSSMCVGPAGQVYGQIMDKEGLLRGICSFSSLEETRSTLPFLADAHGINWGET